MSIQCHATLRRLLKTRFKLKMQHLKYNILSSIDMQTIAK